MINLFKPSYFAIALSEIQNRWLAFVDCIVFECSHVAIVHFDWEQKQIHHHLALTFASSWSASNRCCALHDSAWNDLNTLLTKWRFYGLLFHTYRTAKSSGFLLPYQYCRERCISPQFGHSITEPLHAYFAKPYHEVSRCVCVVIFTMVWNDKFFFDWMLIMSLVVIFFDVISTMFSKCYLPVVHLDGNIYIEIRYSQIAFDIGNTLNLNVSALQVHVPLTVRNVHHMIHSVRHTWNIALGMD